MMQTKFPKNKYETSAYPNLESNAVGKGIPVPLLFGEKTNISPVCINTATLTYKIADETYGAIKAIDAVRADGVTLTPGTDYSTDLPNAEFTIKGTPRLQPSTLYYFVMEGTYTINGTDFCIFNGDDDAGYADGQAYTIDGADAWSDAGADIRFELYGKDDLSGEQTIRVSYYSATTYWPGELRKTASITKLAQSFTTPAGNAFYATGVNFYARREGTPTGNVQVVIHSDQAGTQVGTKSGTFPSQDFAEGENVTAFNWTLRGTPSEILVDAKGYKNADESLMTNVADIMKKIMNEILWIPDAYIDTSAFTSLGAARTQALTMYLAQEIEFKDWVEKLEAGQLFKFLADLNGKYTVIYFASGEPSGTPHIQDEDFLSFRCYRNLNAVKYKIQVKFDENPTTSEYSIREGSSELARFFYQNEETLVVETYLKNAADATQLTTDYSSLFRIPPRELYADMSGAYGFTQIPAQKIKASRARGDNTGGVFNAVLFRLFEITKDVASDTGSIKAILDSQTY